jgi:hypothetical protein
MPVPKQGEQVSPPAKLALHRESQRGKIRQWEKDGLLQPMMGMPSLPDKKYILGSLDISIYQFIRKLC